MVFGQGSVTGKKSKETIDRPGLQPSVVGVSGELPTPPVVPARVLGHLAVSTACADDARAVDLGGGVRLGADIGAVALGWRGLLQVAARHGGRLVQEPSAQGGSQGQRWLLQRRDQGRQCAC